MQGESPRVYFDYNATTPVDAGVLAAMQPFLGPLFGNPSSVHRVGRQARAHVDDARDRVAAVLRCKPSELVFTSGGTEANNLALLGVARRHRDKGRHLVCSTVEHHSVLHPLEYLARCEGFELTQVPVDAQGRVDPADIQKALRPSTLLVSVMAANNEVGTIQAVSEIGALCRQAGVLFHTDAVQWFGKLPFANIDQFGADLVTLCAHKIHGPKGAGLLYVRSPLQVSPQLMGGPQELERRAGTENVPALVGLAAAVERFVREPVFGGDQTRMLTDELRLELIQTEQVQPALTADNALPNTLAIIVNGADSTALVAGLDLAGVCVSSGSACSAGALTPSHVLLAMGYDRYRSSCFLRFSLGRESTVEEVHHAAAVFPNVVGSILEASLG